MLQKNLPINRFLSKVTKTNNHWFWKGSKNNSGYGKILFKGKLIGAHVLSFILFKGNYKSYLDVCHTCDLNICVNPDHLWQGTTSDNMIDCVNKGRHSETRKTHCIRGHELSGDNIRIYRGSRKCIKCLKINNSMSFMYRKK